MRRRPIDFKPQDSVGFLVRDTYREFTKVLQAEIARQGVTLGMWFFLRALWEEDGLTQRELSRRIGMMEPTTVSALAHMERKGLIVRERDPEDRRRRRVFLTKPGRDLKKIMIPYAYEVNRIALDGVASEEVAQLRRILAKMRTNLERHRAAREPPSAKIRRTAEPGSKPGHCR
jgi:DNA-binding MarR family transcriptional regulator